MGNFAVSSANSALTVRDTQEAFCLFDEHFSFSANAAVEAFKLY